jgi:hypothetical protein
MVSFREMMESENLANADIETAVREITPQELQLLSEPPEISYTGEQQEKREALARGMARATADMTPFLGTSIAAAELPEDIETVKGLVSQGYEEKDIVKMGLGSAYGALIALGFIPAAKIATDIGKGAIKSSVAKQTKEAFQTPTRVEQIEMSKKLFPSSKQSRERRQYLKQVNRPTPVVYHGAPELGVRKIPKDAIYIDENLYGMSTYAGEKNNRQIRESLDENVTNVNRNFINSSHKMSKYLSYSDGTKTSMKYIGIKDFNGLQDGTKILYSVPRIPRMLYTSYDEKYNQIEQRGFYLGDFVLDPDSPNRNGGYIPVYDDESGKQVGRMLATEEFKDSVSVVQFTKFLNDKGDEAQELSQQQNMTVHEAGTSRADKLVSDGFDVYGDYAGRYSPQSLAGKNIFTTAKGLQGDSVGIHMELGNKALSTSRDSLVSIKGGFGGFKTSNVVFMELPSARTLNMSRKNYDNYNAGFGNMMEDKVFDDTEGKLVGYNLPKSSHLEAETAVLRPDELRVRKLDPDNKYPSEEDLDLRDSKEIEDLMEEYGVPKATDKFPATGQLSRVDRVVQGQQLANKLVRDADNIRTNILPDMVYFNTKTSLEAYDKLKNYFNQLQMLGKYTEQYAARGTFDSLLTKQNFNIESMNTLAMALAKSGAKQKARNVVVLKEILKEIKLNTPKQSVYPMTDITPSASIVETSSLRNIPKSLIKKALFEDSSLNDFSKDEINMLRTAGINLVDKQNPLDGGLMQYKGLKQLLFMSADTFKKGGLVKRGN